MRIRGARARHSAADHGRMPAFMLAAARHIRQDVIAQQFRRFGVVETVHTLVENEHWLRAWELCESLPAATGPRIGLLRMLNRPLETLLHIL
eukprot:gene14363-biopygen5341